MSSSALTALRDTMLRAAADATTAERLALVDATVLVLARGDDEDAGVWLDFGDGGLDVGDPPADVEPDVSLWMDGELLERFPFFYLALAMADGQVTFEGPRHAVRDVLAAMPVLRTAVENGRKLAGTTA